MSDNLHPAGKNFRGTIVDYGFSETKDGREQVFVKLQNDDTGEIVTAFMALTEKAAEWTVKKLRACGFNGFSFEDLDDGGVALRGNKVLYEVEHDTYNGKTTAKVGWINKPGGIRRAENGARNAARFNSILLEFPPDDPAPQSPSARPVHAAPSGDEPPF